MTDEYKLTDDELKILVEAAADAVCEASDFETEWRILHALWKAFHGRSAVTTNKRLQCWFIFRQEELCNVELMKRLRKGS